MPYIKKLARMIRKVRKEHPKWDVFKFVEEAQKRLKRSERKKKMSDDNIKYYNSNIGEKMIKQMLEEKGKEYGNFSNNAHVVAGFVKSYLEVINKVQLKVPLELIPALMIVFKLTRTIDDGTKKVLHKEDTHKDISGYNTLLRTMMKFRQEEFNGK